MKKHLILLVFLLFSTFCFAQNNLEKLENNYKNAKNDTEKAYSLLKLGIYHDNKEPQKALNYVKKGLEIAYKNKDNDNIILGERYLGMIYFNQNNYTDAIKHNKIVLDYAQETLKNTPKKEENKRKKLIFDQASTYNALGGNNVEIQNNPLSLEYFYKSIELYKSIDYFDEIIDVNMNIGVLFHNQKDYKKALYYFDLANTDAEKTNNYSSIASISMNIANTYYAQNLYDKALITNQKAYKIVTENIDAPATKANILVGIGLAYSGLNEYDKALINYEDANIFYQKINDQTSILNILILKSDILRNTKKYSASENEVDKALILAQEINNDYFLKQIYQLQMKLFLQTNQPEKEEKATNNYKILEEKIRKKKTDAILYELETKYETKQKEQQITFLGREKRIQSLEIEKNIFEIKNKSIALDFADLENLRKQDTIKLKNLSLEKSSTEIAFQKAENEAKAKKIQLSAQEIALKNAEIQNANLQKIILGVSALALLGVALFVFSRFRLARAKQQITEQKLVQERQQADILRIQTILDTQEKERSRIADELHDGLGAEISSLKMMSEKIAFKYQSEPLIQENLAKLSLKSKETVDTMRQIVWAMSENHNQLEDLVNYLQDYAHLYLSENNLKISFQRPQKYKNQMLTFEQRHNIFLTFKEILHNIVKHANAQNVAISIKIDKNIQIFVQDDGVGIAPEKISKFGNGLKNLQKRMSIIAGVFNIQAYLPTGTQAQILMPLVQNI